MKRVRETRPARKPSIDEGLAALSAVQAEHPEWTWSYREIAEECDCSVEAISRIGKAALRKMRWRLAEALVEAGFDPDVFEGPRRCVTHGEAKVRAPLSAQARRNIAEGQRRRRLAERIARARKEAA